MLSTTLSTGNKSVNKREELLPILLVWDYTRIHIIIYSYRDRGWGGAGAGELSFNRVVEGKPH